MLARLLVPALLVIASLFVGRELRQPSLISQSDCSFQAGFAALREQIPAIVGECLEDEWHNPDNGDTLQQTTRGLLVWRKADNWTAFTDGTTTWINGPDGIVSRPNAGPYFPWEGATTAGPPPESTPAPPAPVARSGCGDVPAYPEIRPENATGNRTRASRPSVTWDYNAGDKLWLYYDRITGECQGTTEQILEWAARKWGFDQLGYADIAKAMAVKESWWRQQFKGDRHDGCPWFCGIDYQSYGILQVKRSVWPGSWPAAKESTAFNADYAMAVLRMHYDGNSWLGRGTQGNIRDAVAAWFCGCPKDGNGAYATEVFKYLRSKPWQKPGQPPDNF